MRTNYTLGGPSQAEARVMMSYHPKVYEWIETSAANLIAAAAVAIAWTADSVRS